MPEKNQETSSTKGGMKQPEVDQTPASEGAGRYSGDTSGQENKSQEGQKQAAKAALIKRLVHIKTSYSANNCEFGGT